MNRWKKCAIPPNVSCTEFHWPLSTLLVAVGPYSCSLVQLERRVSFFLKRSVSVPRNKGIGGAPGYRDAHQSFLSLRVQRSALPARSVSCCSSTRFFPQPHLNMNEKSPTTNEPLELQRGFQKHRSSYRLRKVKAEAVEEQRMSSHDSPWSTN